jgi:hypothetical protein
VANKIGDFPLDLGPIVVPKIMGYESEPPPRIECHRDLSAFFYETLNKALSSRRVEAPQHTESYLVQLLSALAHGASVLSQSLVELRCDAELGPREERLSKLRTLGDSALSASSLFEAHLDRQGVSRTYVTDMGMSAYRCASLLASASRHRGERARAEVFFDLGEHFTTYASVLEDVREATALGGGSDVLSLFERYRKTHSPALLEKLLAQGVLPGLADDPRTSEPS